MNMQHMNVQELSMNELEMVDGAVWATVGKAALKAGAAGLAYIGVYEALEAIF